MFIPLQRSILRDLQAYSQLRYNADQSPTGDTIGMIIGLVICGVFLVFFFVFIAYYLAWFSCYDLVCYRWANSYCCNLLRCYFCCPCMDRRAFRNSRLHSSPSGGKMFVQDLLAGPDGSIIHLSDIRPVSGCHNIIHGCNANARHTAENESALI